MQAPVPPPPGSYAPPKACGLAVASLICGCLGFIFIFLTGIPAIIIGHKALERANKTENVNNVRQLQIAAQMYAMDNDGKFPPDLQTLQSAGNIPSLATWRYKDSATKTEHDWLYFAGHKDSDDYDTLLFAAPMTTKGGTSRVVGYLDGSARAVRETEYQRQLLEQQSAESSSGP